MASISKFVQFLKLMKSIREMENLTPHEKLMLLTLATIGDPDGTNIHPGHAYLARCTGLAERTVRRLLNNLEEKERLDDDGRLKNVRQYRLNIPGATPKILTGDISQEEWEEMMLPEEDDSQTDKRPVVTPDQEATVKAPVVKPPAAAPPDIPTTPPAAAPPGPTPEEKRQKDIDFLWSCVNQARRGVPTMTFERFMKSGQRKGIPDDELEWMWNYDFDVGETDSSRSSNQLKDESAPVTFPQPRTGIHQP